MTNLCARLALNTIKEGLLSFALCGGHFLTTGVDCSVQCDNNDIEHAKNIGHGLL